MSTLVTLETLLKTKFEEFYREVSEAIVIDKSLFPKEENIDLLEVTDLLNFLFPDDNTLYNLEQLLELKGIELTDEDKYKLVPILDKMITFVRKIKNMI